MRADQLLVERGVAASRAQAQRLIAAGGVEADHRHAWRRIDKNGEELPGSIGLRVLDDAESRYVSRGGLKLDGALTQLRLDVRGMVCLDVGQSTGGFTDCLLKRGAARVIGIDVGHGQLHPRMATDPRVTGLEGVNARAIDAAGLVAAQHAHWHASAQFGVDDRPDAVAAFELVVGDLSFISLSLVLPALRPLLAAGGMLLMLVKPQFELQHSRQLGKGGIVRDPALFGQAEQRLRTACAACGFDPRCVQWLDSCIAGGDGNREFFMIATL